jgi:outer membrane protein assembly factor BamB
MPRVKEFLYIGIGGTVVALDAKTGDEVWRSERLKMTSFITIALVGERLFAGAGGELFCLDPANGQLLWHNKLKGLGHSVIAFAGAPEAVMAAAMAAAKAAHAAAG